MQQQLQQRLQTLQTEYEAGQTLMAELEAKQANLRDTLLRISGAIQVIEEVLTETPTEPLTEIPENNLINNTPTDTLTNNNIESPSPNGHIVPAEVTL